MSQNQLFSVTPLCNVREGDSPILLTAVQTTPDGETVDINTYIVTMNTLEQWYPKFNWNRMDERKFGAMRTRGSLEAKAEFLFYDSWRSDPDNIARTDAIEEKLQKDKKRYAEELLRKARTPSFKETQTRFSASSKPDIEKAIADKVKQKFTPCETVIAFLPLCGNSSRTSDHITMQYPDGKTRTINSHFLRDPYPEILPRNNQEFYETLLHEKKIPAGLISSFLKLVETNEKESKKRKIQEEEFERSAEEGPSCPLPSPTALPLSPGSRLAQLRKRRKEEKTPRSPPRSPPRTPPSARPSPIRLPTPLPMGPTPGQLAEAARRKHQEQMEELRRQEEELKQAGEIEAAQQRMAAMKEQQEAARRAVERARQQAGGRAGSVPVPTEFLEEPEAALGWLGGVPAPPSPPLSPPKSKPKPSPARPKPEEKKIPTTKTGTGTAPPVKIQGRFFSSLNVPPSQYAAWFAKFQPQDFEEIQADPNFNMARVSKPGFLDAFEIAQAAALFQ